MLTNSTKKRLRNIYDVVAGLGLVGALVMLFVHFDSKNTTSEAMKKATVEKLSTIYESVTKDMSYDEAFEVIFRQLEEMKSENERANQEIADSYEEIDKLNQDITKLNQDIITLNQELEDKKSEISRMNAEMKEMTNKNDDSSSVTDGNSEDSAATSSENESNSRVAKFSDMTTFSKSGSPSVEEMVSDPRGKTYNDAYLFVGQHNHLADGSKYYDRPYLEKYIGAEFERFTVTVMPYKDFDKYNKQVEAYIQIYADDELIYTSENITRKTEELLIDISVKDVKYLKIELNPATELEGFYNVYSVILYEALLVSN